MYSAASDSGFDKKALRRPGRSILSPDNVVSSGVIIGGGLVQAGGGVVGILTLSGTWLLFGAGLTLSSGIAFVGIGVAAFIAGSGAAINTSAALQAVNTYVKPMGLVFAPICGTIANPNFEMSECMGYSDFDAWWDLSMRIFGEKEGEGGWRSELSLTGQGRGWKENSRLSDPEPSPSSRGPSAFDRYKEFQKEQERRETERILGDIDRAGRETGVRDDRPYNIKGDNGHAHA